MKSVELDLAYFKTLNRLELLREGEPASLVQEVGKAGQVAGYLNTEVAGDIRKALEFDPKRKYNLAVELFVRSNEVPEQDLVLYANDASISPNQIQTDILTVRRKVDLESYRFKFLDYVNNGEEYDELVQAASKVGILEEELNKEIEQYKDNQRYGFTLTEIINRGEIKYLEEYLSLIDKVNNRTKCDKYEHLDMIITNLSSKYDNESSVSKLIDQLKAKRLSMLEQAIADRKETPDDLLWSLRIAVLTLKA